jgi:hypothetical protein
MLPPSGKGVIMVAQAIKHGYKWLVGNGKKVYFWKDKWFGTAPLAVQFWNLYCRCNEKSKLLADIWVDGELRVSFRTTFSNEMVQMWELLEVVEDVEFRSEPDALIWTYEKSGTYSTQSFYVCSS